MKTMWNLIKNWNQIFIRGKSLVKLLPQMNNQKFILNHFYNDLFMVNNYKN